MMTTQSNAKVENDIDNIKKDIDNYQQKIESMVENRIQTKFTGDFQKMMIEVKDASTIMTTQSNAKVENDIDNIKKDIQDIIKNQISEIREKRQESKKDYNSLNSTMIQVMNDISELRQDIAKIKENTEEIKTEEKQEEIVLEEVVLEETNEIIEAYNDIVTSTSVEETLNETN